MRDFDDMVPPYTYGRRNGPPRWIIPSLLVIIAGLVAALVYVITTDDDSAEQVAATTVAAATPDATTSTTTAPTVAATTTEPPIDNGVPPVLPADITGYGTLECPNPRDNESFPLEGCHRGQRVGWVQQTLMLAGYEVTVDFLYGSATVAAVKEFQESAGLVPDGAVGPKTWAAMGLPDENGQVSAAQLSIGSVASGTATIDDETYEVVSSCTYSSNYPNYGNLVGHLFVVANDADERVLIELLGYEEAGGVAIRFLAGPRVNMTGFLATEALPTTVSAAAVPLELGGSSVVSFNATVDPAPCDTMELSRPGGGVYIDYGVGDVCEATGDEGVVTTVVSFGFGSQLELSELDGSFTGSFFDEADRFFAVVNGTATVDGDVERVAGALAPDANTVANPDTLSWERSTAEPLRTCAPELVQGD